MSMPGHPTPKEARALHRNMLVSEATKTADDLYMQDNLIRRLVAALTAEAERAAMFESALEDVALVAGGKAADRIHALLERMP